MLADIIILLIGLGYVATFYRAGIWTNLITIVNLITASLLALNYFEPAASWIESKDPSYTYLVDFLMLWGIFCLSMSLMRSVTDYLSKVNVRFKQVLDVPLGGLLSCWAAWLMMSFTALTLHAAPLLRNFLGFMATPETRTVFGLGPDHRLLAFMQKESTGSLAQTVRFIQPDGSVTRGPRMFDPRGEFIFKYGDRRDLLDKHYQATGSLRVRP